MEILHDGKRETKEKNRVTVAVGSERTLFEETNEFGLLSNVLVRCNSADVTLKIIMSGMEESMKLSDAQTMGLGPTAMNSGFFVSKYNSGAGVFVLNFQPMNREPYSNTVIVKLENNSDSEVIVTKAIMTRIWMQIPTPGEPIVAGQEYPDRSFRKVEGL